MKTIVNIVNNPPEPFSVKIEKEKAEIIHRMMNKEPMDRPNIVQVMQHLKIRPLPREADGWQDEPDEPDIK